MTRRADWTHEAQKALSRLDRRTRTRIIAAGDRFAETGHGDVRRLQGVDGFALRVGQWRLLFQVTDEAVVYVAVRPRGRAYRDI